MILRGMRLLGALAILAVGAVHLQQYIGADFSAIPTIGPLFLLNAVGSGIVGFALLLPIERALKARHAEALLVLFAFGAVAIAVGSLIALLISESGSLFGFTEAGYRPPVVVAIITEAATILLLGPVAAVYLARAFSGRRDRSTVWSSTQPGL